MIVKGIVSTVSVERNTAEIFLPEYDNALTPELPFYNRTVVYTNSAKTETNIKSGDFVVLILFNGTNDLCDGVIL